MKRDEPDSTDNSDSEAEEEQTIPFLDTFYGIASTDPRERSLASQAMLHYCLVGPDANTKDAAYALKRLMNGLCSGRSGARQGNASALASFIKISYKEKLVEIMDAEGEEGLSKLQFIRKKLLDTTEVSESKMKRQEERDHRFGRLFGILAIIRSSVLLPDTDTDIEESARVIDGLTKDLIDLYKYKKWMREPAAHAITTLLNSLYAVARTNKNTVHVLDRLVNEMLVPELLSKGDEEDKDAMVDEEELLATFSAEQVAVATNIQAHEELHKELRGPLSQAFFSSDVLPSIAKALSETSSVTQPRTHLVWDVLWLYLTQSDPESSAKNTDVRSLRSKCPISEEGASDVLESVIKHVVLERLLGLGGEESGKATHERRALALCFFRNLLGVEFVSSIAGRTKIRLDVASTESFVLTPTIIKKLFIDIICAGTGKNSSEHMLKPLSLQILDAAVTSACEDSIERRLHLARVIVKVEPRFDTKTKTLTIAKLLGLTEQSTAESSIALLEAAVDMIQTLVVETTENPVVSTGLLDLYVSVFKGLLRLTKDLSGEEEDRRDSLTYTILLSLCLPAFFDCSGTKEKEVKRILKSKGLDSLNKRFLETSISPKSRCFQQISEKSLDLRGALSSRFFSILTEVVLGTLHDNTNLEKDSKAFAFLTALVLSLKTLEDCGARRYIKSTADPDEEDDPMLLFHKLYSFAKEQEPGKSASKDRFVLGCASLGAILVLGAFQSGLSHNPEEDEDDAESDVEDTLEGLNDLAEIQSKLVRDDAGADCLSRLTGVLCDRLSSPDSDAGISTIRLVKELTKLVWIGALGYVAQSKETHISQELLGILLDAVGASANVQDDDEEGEDDSDGENEPTVFTSASGQDVLVEDERMSEGASSDNESDKDMSTDDEDVEVDPERLQTMLEAEDIDEDEEKELEHHAGADAALAKLIQMRKDARKEGQLVKEKQDLVTQIRCTMLLETLLSGKTDGWGSLIKGEHLVFLVFPLIKLRLRLQKSLSRIESRNAPHGERRGLLDRITSILRAKIFKVKSSSIEWIDPKNGEEMLPELLSDLFITVRRRITKEDIEFCSAALNFAAKCCKSESTKKALTREYTEALEEWKSKKNTRLQSSIFDDVIDHNLAFALSSLLLPLAKVAGGAHSSFITSEALRMIGVLYSRAGGSDAEQSRDSVVAVSSSVVEAFTAALQDDDMKKAKRLKEALKALDKVVSFLKTQEELPKLKSEISGLRDSVLASSVDSQSAPVNNLSENIVEGIDSILQKLDTISEPVQLLEKSSAKKKKKKKRK